MTRFGRRDQAFAIALSALAGYVDATGFLGANGFFVSFMSGNSTRLAVGLVQGTPPAALAASLIASFVLGVMMGTFISERAGGRPRPILVLVAVLLAMAACVDLIGKTLVSVLIAAAAMGAENATFARGGDVQIGLTYMTGTLVKLGQRFTHALLGRDPMGWLPFALLWLGLVGGAVLGALVYRHVGFAGLWFAAAAALVLTFFARMPEPADR